MSLTAIERDTLLFLCKPRPIDSLPEDWRKAAYRLEDLGYVEARGAHFDPHYNITDSGRMALAGHPGPPIKTACEGAATTTEEKAVLDHLVTA